MLRHPDVQSTVNSTIQRHRCCQRPQCVSAPSSPFRYEPNCFPKKRLPNFDDHVPQRKNKRKREEKKTSTSVGWARCRLTSPYESGWVSMKSAEMIHKRMIINTHFDSHRSTTFNISRSIYIIWNWNVIVIWTDGWVDSGHIQTFGLSNATDLYPLLLVLSSRCPVVSSMWSA